MSGRLIHRLILSWSQLAEWNESFLVRSSYIWFVSIPICVNVLANVKQDISIPVSQHYTLHLVLALPFSWWLFYFSSVAFAIGRSIFLLECPDLVRRYPHFADFDADGKSTLLLKESFLDAVRSRDDCRARITQFIERFRSRAQIGQPVNVDQFPWGMELEPSLISDAYTFVRNELSVAKPWWRFLCCTAFAIGIALFVVTCVHAFVFVVRYIIVGGLATTA
jgi:hypothetical protein